MPAVCPSAVDYPTNVQARWANDGDVYESFDSVGGLSAPAIGLCNYLQNYCERSEERVAEESYDWNYAFHGTMAGATTVLDQRISGNMTSTNGFKYAILLNARDGQTEAFTPLSAELIYGRNFDWAAQSSLGYSNALPVGQARETRVGQPSFQTEAGRGDALRSPWLLPFRASPRRGVWNLQTGDGGDNREAGDAIRAAATTIIS